MMAEEKKLIEILIPVYNEARNIAPLHESITRIMNGLRNFEFVILFVDDGSSDDSFNEIRRLVNLDPRVKAISLSRNFGKEIALTAGVRASRGDALIMMDADLQHPPEMIPVLIQFWEEGYEVIACDRRFIERRSYWRRLGSWAFNMILNKISETNVQGAGTDFRLLDKKVTNALKQFTERNRLVRGLIDWLGFKRKLVEFDIPPRLHGKANYSVFDLARLAVNSFTSFSLLPLKITGYLGVFIVLLFGSLLTFMFIDKLMKNNFSFSNLAFLAVMNTLSLGVVMMGLGLIALYIGHIFTESVNRPLYVVRDQLNIDTLSNENSSTLKNQS